MSAQEIDKNALTSDKSEDIVKLLGEMQIEDKNEFRAPRNLRPIENSDLLFKTYEKFACEAACILIMHYNTINFATEMEFCKAN